MRAIVDTLTRTWVLAAVAVPVCAFFIANAASSIIEAEAISEAAAPTIVAVAKPPPPARTKLDGTKIERNIFCSSCTPEVIVDGGDRYTGEPAVLIATMIGRDPRATIRVLASEAQGSWGMGERVPGVGTIDRIGSTSIDVVDVSGHRGTISMLDIAKKPKEDDHGKGKDAATSDPFADTVRKISETEYEVDRKLVRELVTGASKPGGVRVVPQMKGSDITGIKLLGVRGDSVAHALGLKSNDTIAAIDGDPIKNVQQLLDLYAKLDQVSAVELTGTRGGKPLLLTLRLR